MIEADILEACNWLMYQCSKEMPDDELWNWPAGWKKANRVSFRQGLCEYYDWEPGDYSIKGEQSEFFVRHVVEYLMLVLEPIMMNWGEVLGQDESDKIRGLARAQAEQEHNDPANLGHSGFFDECDHETCKLIQSIEDEDVEELLL